MSEWEFASPEDYRDWLIDQAILEYARYHPFSFVELQEMLDAGVLRRVRARWPAKGGFVIEPVDGMDDAELRRALKALRQIKIWNIQARARNLKK